MPIVNSSREQVIARLGEKLEAHRRRQKQLHPTLPMTGVYNVLEKVRTRAELTAHERQIHEKGLVSVLKQIHDELDAAVFDAYGWPHDLTDEEILERLVALNHERAEEEGQGVIRWLRPEFQNPASGQQAVQPELGLEAPDEETDEPETPKTQRGKSGGKPSAGKKSTAKMPWPKKLREQIAAVRQTLSNQKGPTTSETIASKFKGAKTKTVEELLDTLASIGQVRLLPDGRYAI